MMTRLEIFVLVLVAFVVLGCQSTSLDKNSTGVIPARQMQAIKSAAKAYTGKDVTDEDIYRMANQLSENAEVQTAIESVANELTQKPVIYYCPIDGKRFSPLVKKCPEHHVELKLVE